MPEVLSGQHGEQADCSVTHHGNGLAGAVLGSDGTEPASAEHVGGGEEARDQVGWRQIGGGHEVPSASGTRAPSACVPMVPMGSRWMHEVW